MKEAVICEPLRTPVGRYGGVFKDVPAVELAATVIRELVRRTGIDPEQHRRRDLRSVLPERRSAGDRPRRRAGCRPAACTFRACSSTGAAARACRRSSTPRCGCRPASADARHRGRRREHEPGRALRAGRSLGRARRFDALLGPHRAGAHHLRRQAPSRCRAACSRRRRTCAANTRSRARRRTSSPAIAPARRCRTAERAASPTRSCRSPVKGKRRGQHGRRSTSTRAPTCRWRALAALKPVRLALDPESTVTAGNASGQNDGAAACIVTTREKAEALGLRPLARLVSWAVAGVEPERMGIGPGAGDGAGACAAPGSTLKDMDLIELNEAFAAQVLAVHRGLVVQAGRLRADERERLGHLARPSRSARRACASWRRCCASSTVARRATGSKRCASAAARASPRSSSAS